jgi:hypothetical protein
VQRLFVVIPIFLSFDYLSCNPPPRLACFLLSMSLPENPDTSHGSARSEPHATTTSTQLSGPQALPELKTRIKAGLRTYPDFPKV